MKHVKSPIQTEKTKNGEARNYFLDEIKHNDLMCENYKKTCKYLNYVEQLLIQLEQLMVVF